MVHLASRSHRTTRHPLRHPRRSGGVQSAHLSTSPARADAFNPGRTATTFAEQFADRIIDMVYAAKISPDTAFEALKIVLNIIADLALDEFEENDPAINARVAAATRAITDLQEEIAGALRNARASTDL